MEQKNQTIERREMLKFLALATGYTFTAGASAAFISGCKADTKAGEIAAESTSSANFFSADEMRMIEAATNRIIPTTDTPGAKEAKVADYIQNAVSYVYEADKKDKFKKGLTDLDKTARDKYKKPFADLDEKGMDDVLTILSDNAKNGKEGEYHVFNELKSLTVTGFATSEVGATQFFKFNAVPGPYRGCVPLSEVGGQWAI